MSSQQHSSPHWYETFFRGAALDLWRALIPREITAAEVAWLERNLALRPGASVLDVPCGQGRHALELARRGYRVTGVDLSQDCLAEARAGADAAGLAIEWRRADMRHLNGNAASFDAAFCFGNSLGYLDASGVEEFLAALHRALRPGARLAVQMGTAAESILPSLAPQRWHRAGDMLMLSTARYVAEHSRLDIDYTFVAGGVIETRPSSSYVFTVAELRRMFERAGWTVESLSRSTAGEPFELGAPGLLLVARRC